MKRAVIITEGGKKIGFGHVTRSLSLYQAFEEKGIKPEFIVNGDSSVKFLMKGIKCRIFNWLKDEKKLLKLLKNTDIVIIDSYLAEIKLYRKISELTEFAVYFDDNNRLDYPPGIVVNGGMNTQNLGYNRKRTNRYLLGSRYAPLRKEFWDISGMKIHKSVMTIMVTFGGDDSKFMTARIIKMLNMVVPDVRKNIIIGKAFKHIFELKRIKDRKLNLVFYPDAEVMKRTMLNSDLAISSGGQTLYELARIGVPTITIAVAENQLNSIRGWQKTGFVYYAGWWNKKDTINKVIFYLEGCRKRSVRMAKSHIGRRFVDGQGPRRIIKELLKGD